MGKLQSIFYFDTRENREFQETKSNFLFQIKNSLQKNTKYQLNYVGWEIMNHEYLTYYNYETWF